MTNLIMSGLQLAIGGGIAYYGYTSAVAPVPMYGIPGSLPGMMGGALKKLFR